MVRRGNQAFDIKNEDCDNEICERVQSRDFNFFLEKKGFGSERLQLN